LKTKVEGILLNKIIFKERDVIGNVLLRNGKKVAVRFYGGKGGGHKKKSSILEFGHLLSLELVRSHRIDPDLYSSRDWKLQWYHQGIRKNFKSFYLMCFFLELIDKLAVTQNLKSTFQEDEEQKGIFGVLSNALYYLDHSSICENFQAGAHSFIFLSKLIFELGVSPNLERSTLSDIPLNEISSMQLLNDQGGFGELDKPASNSENVRGLWQKLSNMWQFRYENYAQFSQEGHDNSKQLFHYLCYQMQIDVHKVKSSRMVFV